MNEIYKEIFNDFSGRDIYIKKENKAQKFKKILNLLHRYHNNFSNEYNLLSDKIFKTKNYFSLENFVTTDIFKTNHLISVNANKILKNISSSGTSGKKSIINLDGDNALAQSVVLKKILEHHFGKIKKTFIFLEKPNSNEYDARKAAIDGFSILSKKKVFPFNNNTIDIKKIINEIKINKESEIVIFGFTSTIWKFFNKYKKEIKKKINKFDNISLIHGGGWKKLEDKKVSKLNFKLFMNKLGFNKIYNYYGLVEQIGSIFIECKNGYFHTSCFSDIIIRDKFLRIQKNKKNGIVQLISLLPTSYPGFSILTQDEGAIYGEDDCKCGLKGKYFKIFGRVKKAELRGCSNV